MKVFLVGRPPKGGWAVLASESGVLISETLFPNYEHVLLGRLQRRQRVGIWPQDSEVVTVPADQVLTHPDFVAALVRSRIEGTPLARWMDTYYFRNS